MTPLSGDANLDGKVDINDLTIVLANYGQTGKTWTTGDFNGDGTVDINDLTIVLTNYGKTSARPPRAFPPCRSRVRLRRHGRPAWLASWPPGGGWHAPRGRRERGHWVGTP